MPRLLTPEQRAQNDARGKAWRAANPERVRANGRRWRSINRERKAAWARDYHLKNRRKKITAASKWAADNPARQRAKMQRWVEANPHYFRDRYASDPQLVVKSRCRNRMAAAVRRASTKKVASTFDLIGCTGAELKAHIEAQFLEGMSWDNRQEWHIDHIRPCCTFDLADPEQQRQCFLYTNLRPLWKPDNLARQRKTWVS